VVVAHKDRRDMAEKLAETVDADHIVWDHGSLGGNANHRAAWLYHQTHPAEWAVTLEDDAVPCKEFRWQLSRALAVAPAHLVSLYLGRGHPSGWQKTFESAVQRAEKVDACWIVGKHSMHAVGLAADNTTVGVVNAALQVFGIYPVDEALCAFTSRNDMPVAYTFPSLVDHADGPSLVKPRDGKPRLPGRVAWKHGGRRRWNDSSVAMAMPFSH
jgi:hypothetical protein